MMTNGDHEGRIFLSHPHKNNGLFFFRGNNLRHSMDVANTLYRAIFD